MKSKHNKSAGNEQMLLALAKKLKKAVSDTRKSLREAMVEVDKTLAAQKI